MEEKISWSAESYLGKTLHKWWDGLDEDRASRAVLRRCSTINEVSLSDAYQHFYRYMLACNAWPDSAKNWQNDKLAAIAGLLAHVKAEDTQRLPIKMSESSDDRPLVSEMRFLDLLKIETTDDLFVSLRRTLPLIGGKADIYQLANDVYFWCDKTKKDWAYSYRWPAKPSA